MRISAACCGMLITLGMQSGGIEAREPANIRITSTDAVIDTSKDPGCGLKLATAEEKIERNARIAKLYFQSYAEAPQKHLEYSLQNYDCMSKDATFLIGSHSPPPAPPTVMPASMQQHLAQQKDNAAQMELQAWQSVFPDIAAVPGTLRIMPWENGVNWSFMYAGTVKGERIEFWESGTMLVNDDGKVVHYECWNDNLSMDKAFRLVFGKSYRDVDMSGSKYIEEIERKLKSER